MNRKFGQKNPGYIFNQTPLYSFVHTKFAIDTQTLFIAIDLLNTKIHTATLYYNNKKCQSVFSEAISHCTIKVLPSQCKAFFWDAAWPCHLSLQDSGILGSEIDVRGNQHLIFCWSRFKYRKSGSYKKFHIQAWTYITR